MAETATLEPKTETKAPAIYAAMLQIQERVGAIAKDKRNEFHKYLYRGIDQLYNVMHPLFVEAGVFVAQAVIQSTDTPLEKGFRVKQRIRLTFVAADASSVAVEFEGEAADSHDRATSKANTDAYKNAIFKTFSIPIDDGSDPEGATPDVAPKKEEATFGKKAEDPKPAAKAPAKSEAKETTTDNPGGTVRKTFVPKVEPFTFKAKSDRKDGTKAGDELTAYRVTSPNGNSITLWGKDDGEFAAAAAAEGREIGFVLKKGKEFKGKAQWDCLSVYDPKTGEASK